MRVASILPKAGCNSRKNTRAVPLEPATIPRTTRCGRKLSTPGELKLTGPNLLGPKSSVSVL
jgi:hypothetical protein